MRSSMGIGCSGVGAPDVIIARKFRWTLEGDHLSPEFNQKLNLDYVRQRIELHVLETIRLPDNDVEIEKWIADLPHWPDERLYLNVFDGCGSPLYRLTFSDLKVISRKSDFDYASSDALSQVLVIRYKHCHREFMPKREDWKLTVHEDGKEVIHDDPIRLPSRPQLFIEETETEDGHWLPGTHYWEKLSLGIDPSLVKVLKNLRSDVTTFTLSFKDEIITIKDVTGIWLTRKHCSLWEMELSFNTCFLDKSAI